MVKAISTTDLARKLGDQALVVVDVRPIAAYNGWQLQGEERGGHILGAAACPLSWTDHLEADDFEMLLRSKGITPDKTVIIYGYAPNESVAMANMLGDMGYKRVLAYEAGLGEWAADANLPMSRLANYEKLVHPEWLHTLIREGYAETYPGRGFAVFHVNFGVPEDYEKGHIAGAIHLDTHALESSSSWNRHTDRDLETALLAHGITRDKTIVLYGRNSEPNPEDRRPGRYAGHIAASRAAAILMYAGVEDVRLLDGGFNGWVSAGYPIDTEWHKPPPAQAFGAQIPGHPDYIIDIEEAKALLTDPDGILVSIRIWSEFIGETSGYNYIERKGRIPGAVWGNGGSDAYHMQHYRNIDNTMRAYHEIESNWRDAGITPDKRVAFYCGTGWRASETFFYAYLMGWPHVAVYDGGWFEWSKNETNPVDSGIPQHVSQQ